MFVVLKYLLNLMRAEYKDSIKPKYMKYKDPRSINLTTLK
jgi:hypothetical protein